jgi:hypothetical protein
MLTDIVPVDAACSDTTCGAERTRQNDEQKAALTSARRTKISNLRLNDFVEDAEDELRGRILIAVLR